RSEAGPERPTVGGGTGPAEGAVRAGTEVGAGPRPPRARTHRGDCREQGGGESRSATGRRAERKRQRSRNCGRSASSDEVATSVQDRSAHGVGRGGLRLPRALPDQAEGRIDPTHPGLSMSNNRKTWISVIIAAAVAARVPP